MKVTLKKPVEVMEIGKWYELGDGHKRMLVKVILGEDAGKVMAINDHYRQSGIYTSEIQAVSRYKTGTFGGVFETKEVEFCVGSVLHLKTGKKRIVVKLVDGRYTTISPDNWEECISFSTLQRLYDNYKNIIVDITKAEL